MITIAAMSFIRGSLFSPLYIFYLKLKISRAYMQKTCDVAEKAILAKKIAEKVRKLRQKCVNRENRQKMVLLPSKMVLPPS